MRVRGAMPASAARLGGHSHAEFFRRARQQVSRPADALSRTYRDPHCSPAIGSGGRSFGFRSYRTSHRSSLSANTRTSRAMANASTISLQPAATPAASYDREGSLDMAEQRNKRKRIMLALQGAVAADGFEKSGAKGGREALAG